MAIKKTLKIPSFLLPSLYKQGRKFRFSSFNLINAQNNGLNARVSVTVGKKIDKRATVRNRIKRLILEAYKSVSGKISLKPLDLVFIVSKNAINKTKEDLEKEIYQSFVKTNLINDKKTSS